MTRTLEPASSPLHDVPFARPVRGRGAASNPRDRFGRRHVDLDPGHEPMAHVPTGRGGTATAVLGEEVRIEVGGRDAAAPGTAMAGVLPSVQRTTYLRDASRTIIATNDSPDIPFAASINPYRGCEHGCAYCYARPTHEFLGFSSGLDFESRILVKMDAPGLLRAALRRPGWKPQVLAMSGVTDPYQPIERRLRLSRRCLEVLAEFRNPVAIVTKSHLVTRDIDVLSELARHDCVSVSLSITTLQARLARALEPRAAQPLHRLHAIHRLAAAGIPVGVMVAPVIPGLTDQEIPSILDAAAQASATRATYVPLRLPHAVADLFSEWLEHHAPDRKDKVLSRVRGMRGGRLNDAQFGSRMRGRGPFAQQIHDLFRLGCRRAGLPAPAGDPLSTSITGALSTEAFRRTKEAQLDLFDV